MKKITDALMELFVLCMAVDLLIGIVLANVLAFAAVFGAMYALAMMQP